MTSTKQRGFLNEIGASIFESGANTSVIIAINCMFSALIVTLCVLMLLWGINIHFVFMTVLAVGLMMSINWLVHVIMTLVFIYFSALDTRLYKVF